MILKFNSITSLVDAAKGTDNARRGDDEWCNGSWDDAVRLSRGHTPGVAERAMELVNSMLDAPSAGDFPLLEYGVAGHAPCVPSFLAGSPESMMTLSNQHCSQGARLFISVCVSAGISPEEAEQRGIAALALALRLSRSRPVELWAFADLGANDSDAYIPMVRIETTPLDVASAAFMLCNVLALRRLCFGAGERHGFNGMWAWGSYPGAPGYEARLRDHLELAPTDLMLSGGFLLDKNRGSPREWVNEKFREFNEGVQ